MFMFYSLLFSCIMCGHVETRMTSGNVSACLAIEYS